VYNLNHNCAELVEIFAQQIGLQRKQVKKEVIQLLQQLRDGRLIGITIQVNTPNVEFKK
jgi:hypothetical protein